MNLYQKWIAKLDEKGFMKHKAIKKVKEFNWGLKDFSIEELVNNPLDFFLVYNTRNILNSKSYFFPPKLSASDYYLKQNILSFPSTISTNYEENNTAFFNYYPVDKSRGVIIVIPHWNAEGERYDRIARQLNKIKYSTIRMVLPFHGQRGNGSPETSTRMVSANIGLTLLALQQSVRDVLSCVDWLEMVGYKNIGILSSSIGSCIGFLTAAHDSRVNCLFANHMSSFFGDVVWTGISTQHIKKSLVNKISKEDLRKCWALNSPFFFVHQLIQNNKNLKLFIMSGRYDSTFEYDLTLQIFNELDKSQFKYQKMILPCGHYSLGNLWFKYIDAYQIARFFIQASK